MYARAAYYVCTSLDAVRLLLLDCCSKLWYYSKLDKIRNIDLTRLLPCLVHITVIRQMMEDVNTFLLNLQNLHVALRRQAVLDSEQGRVLGTAIGEIVNLVRRARFNRFIPQAFLPLRNLPPPKVRHYDMIPTLHVVCLASLRFFALFFSWHRILHFVFRWRMRNVLFVSGTEPPDNLEFWWWWNL